MVWSAVRKPSVESDVYKRQAFYRKRHYFGNAKSKHLKKLGYRDLSGKIDKVDGSLKFGG